MDDELMITVPFETFQGAVEDATRFDALVDGLLASALLEPYSDEDLYIERETFRVLMKAICPNSYAYRARKLKEQKDELLRKWQEETKCE